MFPAERPTTRGEVESTLPVVASMRETVPSCVLKVHAEPSPAAMAGRATSDRDRLPHDARSCCVDASDRFVEPAHDPGVAFLGYDADGSVADGDRLADDLPRLWIESGDPVALVEDHPDCILAGRHASPHWPPIVSTRLTPAEEATRRPPRCPKELAPPTPPAAPPSGEASNRAAART